VRISVDKHEDTRTVARTVPADQKGKWRVVALLFFVAALNYGDRTSISSVFPLLRRDLGMSDVELAATGSFFLWSYALLSPLAGYVGDRFSRSSLIVASLFGWSCVTLATGFVTSSAQLLAMRVFLGVAECVYIPASIALIADYHSTHTRATALSIHLSGFYFGMVIGGTLAGYLGDTYGWRPTFFVLGAMGMLLGLICRFLLRDVKPENSHSSIDTSNASSASVGRALGSVFRTPSYLILLGEAMVMAGGTWALSNWLPLYLQETFHLNLARAGFFGTFILQSAGILGILAGGHFSDRVARLGVKYRMLLHALCYLTGVPFLLSFLWSTSFAWVALSAFAFTLMQSLGAANSQPLLCELLKPRQRSTAVGFMNMTNCLAGGAGILIAGYLKSRLGLAGVFAGNSGFVMASAVILLIGFRFVVQKDLQRAEVPVPNGAP
jgi:MFS transporter, Spinster family, sphingosine-1-phosphate transporter